MAKWFFVSNYLVIAKVRIGGLDRRSGWKGLVAQVAVANKLWTRLFDSHVLKLYHCLKTPSHFTEACLTR
jgi:hypothetical protein